MNSYLKTALIVCISATLVVTGVITYALVKGDDDSWLGTGGSLTSFSSYDQLSSFLSESMDDEYPQSTYYREDFALSGDSPESSTDYSTTNVQVSGVDEEDIVKTDGEHIFVAGGDTVTIVEAYPPDEMEIVSRLNSADLIGDKGDNTNLHVTGMYVSDDRLVVISNLFI